MPFLYARQSLDKPANRNCIICISHIKILIHILSFLFIVVMKSGASIDIFAYCNLFLYVACYNCDYKYTYFVDLLLR